MYKLVVAGVLTLAVAGLAYVTGWKHAQNSRDAQELAVARGMEKAAQAALAVVEELPKKFIPIKGDLQKEFHYETRYVAADCEHTAAVWLHLQRAYEAAGGTWPGDRVPVADPAAGQNPGGNNQGTGGRVGSAGEVSRSDGN